MRTMKASEFKAKCLQVLDEVQATGEPVQITKRGKVVAQLGVAGCGAGDTPANQQAQADRVAALFPPLLFGGAEILVPGWKADVRGDYGERDDSWPQPLDKAG